MITLYTIGFTKKSAHDFFELLKKHKIRTVIDVRISNSSQLAGFAKGNDLAYFLKEIGGIGYKHITDFAPTKELLSDYRAGKVDWNEYVKIYNLLMEHRSINKKYKVSNFDNCCFLCSEEEPKMCHRRLLAEHLRLQAPEDTRIVHLV
ncbi:MAG: DUF488 domain-containing protein [Paludibacteraceae bacterium]|nr:DUF488 domain-containing protein [Paludibacteraceae bacterium]